MEEVVHLYNSGMSLRQIGNALGFSHKHAKKILLENDIEPMRQRIATPPSASRIEQCAANGRLWRGKKRGPHSGSRKFQNSISRSKMNLSEDDFPDVERFLFLTRYTAKHKSKISNREEFLLYFYHDVNFNIQYDNWLVSGKDRWLIPTLDHKIPLSRGGNFDRDNLHFMTWFENRAKADMTLDEWHSFKTAHSITSSLFL